MYNFSLLILFIGGIALTIGDLIMKEWVLNNKLSFYLLGIFVYLIGLLFLSYSFKFENIAIASALFVIFNIITLLLFSYFYFKEPLSWQQLVGVGLAITSIIILEIK